MQGRTLETVVPVKRVLAPGDKTSFDNRYAGIVFTYFDQSKNELLGSCHAEDRVGKPEQTFNPNLKGSFRELVRRVYC